MKCVRVTRKYLQLNDIVIIMMVIVVVGITVVFVVFVVIAILLLKVSLEGTFVL
jgi:hypothetical protein